MPILDTSKVADVLERIRLLESMYVKVGVISSAGGQMLMIANVHEFGCDIPVTDKMRGFFIYNFGVALRADTKTIKIPERSFIRSSFDSKGDQVGDQGERLLDQVVNGDLPVKAFYDLLGQTSVNAIRNFLIQNVTSPANVALTIANKGGKSNPLVNTGRLVGSIDYEIVGG